MTVLVVDGANVVGSRPDGWWKDRAGAARRLHEALLVADTPYDEVVLVLEGQAKGGVKAGRDGHVRTVHAKGERRRRRSSSRPRAAAGGATGSWSSPPTGSSRPGSGEWAPRRSARPGCSTSSRPSPAGSAGGHPGDREGHGADHLGRGRPARRRPPRRRRRCRAGRSGPRRPRTPAASDGEAPSEPPSTTASGLRLLHRSARARPTERPASLSTRRTPASPSVSRSRTLSTVSCSSYAGCSSASRRGAETTVSRQPRLPQRQTWPSSPTWTWPISPAMPVAPRCSRPPSTMPAPRPLATLT